MTTNFLQKIDDVALKRRVDYYLKFDTMTPDQIEQMFVRFYPMHEADAVHPAKVFRQTTSVAKRD